jgi:hypothetical protein
LRGMYCGRSVRSRGGAEYNAASLRCGADLGRYASGQLLARRLCHGMEADVTCENDTGWFVDARFGMFVHWGLRRLRRGTGGQRDRGTWRKGRGLGAPNKTIAWPLRRRQHRSPQRGGLHVWQ